MSDRIRAQHPDFFMFGESFQYDANFIAQHTLPKNGGVSVLDFPMQKAMVEVFEKPLESDFSTLEEVLFLTHGPYNNPYDLTTFYDNHDMARINATDNGFINAHNWLFTARGIPVIYQGSEIGFMRGTSEHQGNRNYFGQDNIDAAPAHPIYQKLRNIANVRKTTPALQRGLQVNLAFEGHSAAFYRILQHEDINQIALVLLNKGSEPKAFTIDQFMQQGEWVEQLSGDTQTVDSQAQLSTTVEANGVEVWVLNDQIKHPALLNTVVSQMARQ